MIEPNRIKQLKEFLDSIDIKIPLENVNIALTHSSFCRENNFPYELCNERLEFLGDAVLKIIISDYLYKRFPSYNEGDLSQIRSYIVSDETLDKIARKIKLPEYLILGYSEENNGGRWRSSTIACAFEAFLGALYLEDGLKQSYKLLEKLFDSEVTSVDADGAKSNYKALLQEYFQSISNSVPSYILTKQEGPPHNRTFYVDVFFENDFLASGSGVTKKTAQKEAAKKACAKLGLIKQQGENNV